MEINYCYKFLLLNFKRVWLQFPLSSLLLFFTSDFKKERRRKFQLIKPNLVEINEEKLIELWI